MSQLALTIDELARQEGLPASTIRLYVKDGLLERPVREGRQAFYGPDHVRTLRSIRRLSDRGFSLAAIRQVFDLDRSGADLGALLADPTDQPSLEPSDFAALLFPDGEIDWDMVSRAAELGVISFDEGEVRFADHRHLRNALALAELGVSGSSAVDVWETLSKGIEKIVDQFVALIDPILLAEDEHLLNRVIALGRDAIQVAYEGEIQRRLKGDP